MENCTFCGHGVPAGTGKMYVKKDATILWFCSRRCEKNLLKLGRNPRTTKFTMAAKKTKEQTMAAQAHEKQHKKDVAEGKVETTPVKATKSKTAKPVAKAKPVKKVEEE